MRILTLLAACSLLAAMAVADESAPDAARIKAFCVDFNWGDAGFAPPGMYAGASAAEHLAWYKKLGVNTIQTFCVSCPGCRIGQDAASGDDNAEEDD